MDSNTIAIDVVLLPSPEIIRIVTDLNERFSDTKKYVSFKDGYVPHISVGMCVVTLNDLEDLKKEIKKVSEKNIPFQTTTTENATVSFATKKIFEIGLESCKEMLEIHQTCMNIFSKYPKHVSKPDMFDEPGRIDELTTGWVDTYPGKSGIFKPHITIGAGELLEKIPPQQFIVDTIAIYQIGPFCTCKKELARFTHK